MSTRTLFVSMLFVSLLAAQASVQRQEGKIVFNSPADNLYVEIYEGNGHMLADRATVSRDGMFSVNVVPSRTYEVRVVNRHGDRVFSDYITYRPGAPWELKMPASDTSGPLPAGPISVVRLSHKPAKSAMKLAREAESFAGKGDLNSSTERLLRATEADPKWFEAWNNLGARHISTGQYAAALDAFRTALSIDPNDSIVHSNLGLAYLFLRRAPEAETAAARALQLDPSSTRAAYVAGLALLQQNNNTDEALATLRMAGKELPRALLAVAEWKCRHDDFRGCETELKTFLKTPRGPNHEAAEKWLKQVRAQLAR